MGGVLVLNSDRTVLCFVSWQRAVQLMLSTDPKGQPQAVIFEADPDREVRSPSTSVPFPRIIRLTRWHYARYSDRVVMLTDPGVFATPKDILDRDSRTCAYCGMPGSTIDHVMPRSRGGPNSWENLVAACSPCNNRKADRTPEEAGMRLRWHPYRPEPFAALQRRVWAAPEPEAA